MDDHNQLLCVCIIVVITDPAISNQGTSYKPYEDGIDMNVFIKVFGTV